MKNETSRIENYLLLLAKLQFPQIENLEQLPALIEDMNAGREFIEKILKEREN